MANKVQGMIIQNQHILTVQGIDENGRRENFFISGQREENESAMDAMKRALKEQLNIDQEITFQFTKGVMNGVDTFLIDLQQEEVSLDCDLEKIKCFSNSFKAAELRWTRLSDRRAFREFETQCVKLLFEEAVKNDYYSPWVDSIRNTYFSGQIGRAYLHNFYRQKERNKVDATEGRNNKIIGMSMALGLGLLFDYFFIWDHIGISGFIFSMAIIFAAVYGNDQRTAWNKKLGFVFLIPIVLLSLSFSIYNDIVLRMLNVILIPFLITGYLITIRYDHIKELGLSLIINIFDRVFEKSFSVLPKFFVFGKELTGEGKKLKKNSIHRNIIRGLLISIPLLVVILLLLTSADMMFRHYVENMGSLFEGFNLKSLLGHIFVIAAISLYMFGFLWSFKYREIYDKHRTGNVLKASWEPITIITIVFVINIIYLLFSIVQFSYLYGGGLHALPEGFSYAEYARRGFFELIMVTLINFVILLLSIHLTKKDNQRINKIANVSYSLLILFTFNMLVSASYKMYLYETAFGFSRLRIFVQAFMILIGILLVIVLLGIWIQKIPVFKYAVIATLTVYVGLNFMNVDGLIARENIARYEATGKIDIHYIKQLSYDAIPEIIKLLDTEDTVIRSQVRGYLNAQKGRLNGEYDHWYEYNYHKSKLLKMTDQ